MAVMLHLDFAAYFIPGTVISDDFADQITQCNAESSELARLWKHYSEIETKAVGLLRQPEGVRGIRYSAMQASLAESIDVALEIIDRELELFRVVVPLIEKLHGAGLIDAGMQYRMRTQIFDNHLKCTTFAQRIKQHLSRTLFVDLQIG